MPLYLVRWSEGRVSLVRARDEHDLTSVIDDSASPSECTWKMYGGPVWIDFEVAGLRHVGERPGPADPEDFRFDAGDGLPKLVVHDSDEPETHNQMDAQIMRWAFPRLWRVLDKLFDESLGLAESFSDDAMRAQASRAACTDEVRHSDARMEKSTTLDSAFNPIPTRRWYLVKGDDGFRRIPVARVERFCYGRAALKPASDGFVRLATFESHWSMEEGKTKVAFNCAIRLRADAHGMVDGVHRADAFESAEQEAVPSLFERRRNAAVEWALTDADWEGIRAFFERKFWHPIVVLRDS